MKGARFRRDNAGTPSGPDALIRIYPTPDAASSEIKKETPVSGVSPFVAATFGDFLGQALSIATNLASILAMRRR
jgi:hypothetical protein